MTSDNNGPHVHGLGVHAAYAQPSSAVGGITLGDAGVTRETTSSGKGIPFSILPPYRAVYVQIRAKPDPVVAQNVPQPNLLDNSDFTNPVNQRGQSSYTLTGGYCIDRWRLSNGSYTVDTRQLVLTPTGTGRASANMQEYILWKNLWKEGDTLTLSASINGEVFSVTGVFPVWAGSSNCYMAVDISADYELASWRSNIETRASVVIQNKEGHSAQGVFALDWIKLEKGSVATPYAPKGYGAELTECMRYFERCVFPGLAYISWGDAQRITCGRFSVLKRDIPKGSNILVKDGESGADIAGITGFIGARADCVTATGPVLNTLITGKMYTVQADFSADL